MKKANNKKFLLLFVALFAIILTVVIPAYADENNSDGVGNEDELHVANAYYEYTQLKDEDGNPVFDEKGLPVRGSIEDATKFDLENEYDDAYNYLDKYTDRKDPNQPLVYDEEWELNVPLAKKTVQKDTPLYGTWWALLPPLIAIALALITKEVYSSLFIGIVAGGLMVANFSPAKAMDFIIGSGLTEAVSGNAGIFVFLVILGIMVVMMNKSGGTAAFGRWAQSHIKSQVGASIATFILGVLIFIDDYFNCLTVGSIMRPVTDSNKISRAKLAFLIDATAAPICMIAPISSWAAAVSSYAPKGEGFSLFIKAIPYNFYSLLTLVFIVGIVVMKVDYGPMRRHELNAHNGDLFTSGKENVAADDMEKGNEKGIVLDIIFPIVTLIICCVAALLYVGNECSFTGMNVMEAFSATDATVGLPWGALLALIISIFYYAIRRVVKFKESMDSIPSGFKAMVSAIIILTFATALKNMTTLLGAKIRVAEFMESNAGSLQNFLPAIIFLVACVLAFSTGTSWGTFGILIPIVTAMFPAGGTILTISISACLAGAVCGDHCSPISDTTIMSSAGAQCDHLNHVSTQLPYALTVAAISFVNFIIAPFIDNVVISLFIAVVMTVAVLYVIKLLNRKKA